VAADAQFTPKSVETEDERQKLMFPVKLQIDPDLLRKHRRYVKTGIRGVGFVRTSASASWPGDLTVKLP
jgi:HlyD family secretion protein